MRRRARTSVRRTASHVSKTRHKRVVLMGRINVSRWASVPSIAGVSLLSWKVEVTCAIANSRRLRLVRRKFPLQHPRCSLRYHVRLGYEIVTSSVSYIVNTCESICYLISCVYKAHSNALQLPRPPK